MLGTRSGRVALAALIACVGAGACRSAAPLAGADPRTAMGTITGRVSGPEEHDVLPGRVVEAIHVESGALYSGQTGVGGRYSIELPPGRYRMDIEPALGEEIVESPDLVEVDPGELLTDVDFRLGGAGTGEDDSPGP